MSLKQCLLICMITTVFYPWTDGTSPIADTHLPSTMDVTVYEFSNCPGMGQLLFSYDDITVIMDPTSNALRVSGNLTLREPWTESLIIKLTFSKCKDRSIDSCDTFLESDFRDLCNCVKDHLPPWSDFFEKMPTITNCPVAPGVYPIVDAPIDMEELNKMTISYGYWRLRFSMERNDEFIMCNMASLELKTKKKKKKKPRKS